MIAGRAKAEKSWYAIRAARTTAEIRLYGEIGSSGISAERFAADVAALGELKRLDVRINSIGGDLMEAIAIHAMLQRHPARVEVFIDGLCASCATVVALAGDVARMVENGQYMIHEPWVSTVGDAERLQTLSDMLDATAQQLVGLYARKTGLEPDTIREMMRVETWLTAAQALELGFIDAIDEPLRIAAKTFDLSRFSNPPRGASMPSDLQPIPDPPADADPAAPEPVVPEPVVPEPVVPDPAALEPAVLARACLDAGEPNLIPVLLHRASVTQNELAERVANAKEIRALCRVARQPDRADEIIRSDRTPDQAKALLWDALVAADRAAGEIDGTPPPPAGRDVADPTALARSALQYQHAQSAFGQPISFAEAVAHVAKSGVRNS